MGNKKKKFPPPPSVEDVPDTMDLENMGDIMADTVKDTMYPKECKVAKESVTRSHLTKKII